MEFNKLITPNAILKIRLITNSAGIAGQRCCLFATAAAMNCRPAINSAANAGKRLLRKANKINRSKLVEGERKHVTVLFSDLSGYTAMSVQLDPEEVKEITGHIFGDLLTIGTNVYNSSKSLFLELAGYILVQDA